MQDEFLDAHVLENFGHFAIQDHLLGPSLVEDFSSFGGCWVMGLVERGGLRD